MTDERIELSIRQASRESGVPESTIRRWAAGGFIEARKIGRDWFVRQGSLQARAGRRSERSGEIRIALQLLVGRLRDDDNCTWINQVPYVVRTEIVDALEDILNA